MDPHPRRWTMIYHTYVTSMSVLHHSNHGHPLCGMRPGGLQLRPVKGFAVVHQAGSIAEDMLKLEELPLHDLVEQRG